MLGALATVALLTCATVMVREEVLPARPDVDGWHVKGTDCSFASSNGFACITLGPNGGKLYPKRRFPGPRRMRGASAYVLKTDGAFDGEATMTVRREAKDHGTNVLRRARTMGAKEMRFDFDLAASEAWYLEDIRFKPAKNARPRSFRLMGVDAVTTETPAQALRVDVETGNAFRLVRDGKDERAELVLRNPSTRPIDGHVGLCVEDFFGNRRTCELSETLEPGGERRHPLKESLPKGIRYVTAVVTSAGTAATNRTTWAYVDLHERTPKQPSGEFRLGVNFHGMRYTPGERADGLAALVALGAKLVRTDAMLFSGVRPSPDVWNWKPCDGYLSQLEERGLDLNAIIWWPSPWATARTADGEPLDVIRPGLLHEYGKRLGERYGTRVAYYEVGNEWDMSRPQRLPYEEAVRQVRELAGGIKSACPAAKVLPCGFATESSLRHPSGRIRPLFHENLVRDVKDVVDAHPVHGHSPAREYAHKIRSLLEWRQRLGVKLPWYANETSVTTTTMRPTDRAAAVTVWQKVLFSWSRGSVDYIWYNLRATGWDPTDSEQGYGMFTADLHPRASAAAFAALATTFRHLTADRIAFDGKDRQILCFRDAHGCKTRVVAGWDANAREPMSVRVKTDATAAWQVDTMGNRTAVRIRSGCAVWRVSENPSALRLENASFATPDAEDAANAAKRPVKVIIPGSQFQGKERAEIQLKDYDQVYEVYKAIPECAGLTWKWWGDLWVWVHTACSDGRLKIRVVCEDDVHQPEPEDPLQGDCAVVRLGDWKLALVGTPHPFAKVLERPVGVKEDPPDAWTLTFRKAYCKTYDLEVDPSALGLEDEIPFNVRVYDNDGKGLKCWMEHSPLDEKPEAVIRLGADHLTGVRGPHEQYLDLMEVAVAAYTDEHLAAYLADVERDGVQEHGFPRLAANLGVLIANGRCAERRETCRRMMTICCRDAAKGPMPPKSGGNEFSVRELVEAVVALEQAGVFPKDVTDGWRTTLASVVAERSYTTGRLELGLAEPKNWVVFAAASEQSRLRHGMGGDRAFVERHVADQLRWFDENGMYRDAATNPPAVYDIVTRLQFASLLRDGYDGPSRGELETQMEKSAEPTLKMLSTAGELPCGGRSNQFLHNNTLYAALCEWYAERFAARGDIRRAARFRRAAVESVAALRPWLAETPVSHVKNRYPRETGKSVYATRCDMGCERYAYFDKYMVTMASWAQLANLFANGVVSGVSADAAPAADAFATSAHFGFVFLKAGDYSAQLLQTANPRYDCVGLGRLHRRGAPAALCLSTACVKSPSYRIESPNDAPLAISPVGCEALAVRETSVEGGRAVCKTDVGWRLELTADGLMMSLSGAGPVALTLPAFAFDGKDETQVVAAGQTLTVSYRGWKCIYETDGEFVDTGRSACNRNGRYRRFEAHGNGNLKVSVRMTGPSSPFGSLPGSVGFRASSD